MQTHDDDFVYLRRLPVEEVLRPSVVLGPLKTSYSWTAKTSSRALWCSGVTIVKIMYFYVLKWKRGL
jgi:hypothetical protein